MTNLLEREAPLLAALNQAQRARQGQGSILLVYGEAGIGKSSFIEAWLARLPRGWRVMQGVCEDLFSPRPLGPLRDMASVLHGPLQASLEQHHTAENVFGAFLALLDTAAVPSVVVLEDLHWADEATLDLIKFLGRRIRRLPVLLVLSYRDDELGVVHPLHRLLGDLPADAVMRHKLRPLTPDAVSELAAQAGRPPAGLHSLTNGNPFYVTEVLASEQEGAGVSGAVRDAMRSRLTRLAPAERELLQALCVFPARVPLRQVQALLPPGGAQALDGCLARGLLRLEGNHVGFRHELGRHAVLDTLPPLQRRRRHAQALSLARQAPEPTPLSRLVHFATEAVDAATVLELAPKAAIEASAVGAHREAAQQLAAALRFADDAPVQQRAELFESWSYEAGLSLAGYAQVIEARRQALDLWRQAGRQDKVGHNLRWLSRLHWYMGDGERALALADEATAVLEQLPPSADLAWAFSTRAQFFMLQDRTELALAWGARAIELATALGEQEILCHALNSVGTAELFAGLAGGLPKLEQSLALALAGGFHEQAARVYTNVSEHAVVFKNYGLADRWLAQGIAFDRRHDLDAWTHYLAGWQAQLRLEQGRFADAERIAVETLDMPRLTPLMRLPALTVLARLRMRQQACDASALVDEALAIARSTGEVQRLLPLVVAQAEHAWLVGDAAGCLRTLATLDDHAGVDINAWWAGELACWRLRAGQPVPATTAVAEPWQLELEGRGAEAAERWLALGAPYEAAMSLLQAALSGPRTSAADFLAGALRLLEPLGARLAAARVRELARGWGISQALPAPRRGPYGHARHHPAGLTAKEQQVLDQLAAGLSNLDIARRSGNAVRTVEHHVSAVLRKLAAHDRAEAVATARDLGLVKPGSPGREN